MEEKKKKVVVAFSGGLDTSFTVMYLAKEKGYEVYAACANTGGFSEEQLKQNEENAYKLGAVKYVTLDVTREYYEKSLKYMVFGNVLRNGTYPISVSSERIFQGLAIARYANEIGADAIAHGSTGAGNDQIRFDMTFLVLAPGVEIITLTRDMALSRQQEIDYLNEHGFAADFTKLKYSYNVGLWGENPCFLFNDFDGRRFSIPYRPGHTGLFCSADFAVRRILPIAEETAEEFSFGKFSGITQA